jgi:opacity protein-like surface antigen
MRTTRVAAAAAAILTLFSIQHAHAQTWTGGYIAGHAGSGMQFNNSDETIRFDNNLDGAFGDPILTIAGANAFSPGFCGGAAQNALPASGCAEDEDGFAVGVRGGYDWQVGPLVVGGLGAISWHDATDSVSAFSTTPAFYTFTRDLEWLTSLGGRAGVAAGRTLLYGTGAAVWARLDNSFSTSNAVNTFVRSADDSSRGYQAGGGIEYRLATHLTLGGEYLLTRLDDKDRFTVRAQGPAPATNPFILANPAGTDFRRSDDLKLQSIRVTVGYRF